ncbi:hypothetical protein JR316_0012279 [Psilocybe cubensis]|uniref:Uncharacterized protein n=1 Tax=Psilocybe cubensis TaxID=181762 RepID=A0ACB8GHY2_PSICU|nr:hypothetical protein JR316_0012279 [Psilocybe cubensis]KAH9475168.1 hypothetical protein JR316_0012279 [Psilocybe cubensis]
MVHLPSSIKVVIMRIATGVMHDSAERSPLPKFDLRISQAIVSDIDEWINEEVMNATSSTARILWVNGPTASDKTALAQLIAEICQQNGQLGASFFFPRKLEEQELTVTVARKLVLTLAYQLAISLPEVGQIINELIAADPSVLDKSADIQMQRLIVAPMGSIQKIMAVVIDGLDTCRDVVAQQQIITILAAAANGISSIRFIVTSKDTAWMRVGLMNSSLHQKIFEMRTDLSLPKNKNRLKDLLPGAYTKALNKIWRRNYSP